MRLLSPTHYGLAAFLAVHLTLASVSAVRGTLQTAEYAKVGPGRQIHYPLWLENYAFLTSTAQGFGFFAPAVSADVRMKILSASSKGGAWHERNLPSGFAAENNLGTFLGFGVFEEGKKGRAVQGILAQSVATGVFNRYPDDNLVIIQYQAEWLGRSKVPRDPPQWINLRVLTFYR